MRRSNLVAHIALIVGLVCLLGLTACKSQSSSLVGIWSVSMGSQASSGGSTWQFTKEGKMIQGGGGVQKTTADYSLSGNTLTLVTTVSGKSVPTTMTVQWVSNDQFKGAISGMGSTPLTFTRQR